MSQVKKAETMAPAIDPPTAPEASTPSHTPIRELLSSTFKDRGNLLTMLAGAGASGVLGGMTAAKAPTRRGETPGQRRARILANALGFSAAGGAATGAGVLGAKILNSRNLPEPGFLAKVYDNTAGKLGTGTQAGGIVGAATGTFAGVSKGLKDHAAVKIDQRALLNKVGDGIQTGRISPERIGQAFAEGAPAKMRVATLNALRNEMFGQSGQNPAMSRAVRAQNNVRIQKIIHNAGLSSGLSFKDKAKLNAGALGRGVRTTAGRSLGYGAAGAGIGFGLEKLLSALGAAADR